MRVDPKLVIHVLQKNKGAIRLTARELGISPGTVRNWQRRAYTGRGTGRKVYATKDLARRSTAPGLPAVDQALAIEALGYIVPLLPFTPDFVQTDNGLEFQARFTQYVTKDLGWEHHHIYKSSPNENTVIERSFRTDEEEFFWRLRLPRAPKDAVELSSWYQDWLVYYNEERLHMGTNFQTPGEKLASASSAD